MPLEEASLAGAGVGGRDGLWVACQCVCVCQRVHARAGLGAAVLERGSEGLLVSLKAFDNKE